MGMWLWIEETEDIVRQNWGKVSPADIAELVTEYQMNLCWQTKKAQFGASAGGVICTAERLGLISKAERDEWFRTRAREYQRAYRQKKRAPHILRRASN